MTIPFNHDVIPLVPNNGTDFGTDQSDKILSNKEKPIILELVKDPETTYNSRAIASLLGKKYIERIGNKKTGFCKIIR